MQGEAQLGRYYTLVLLFIGAMAGLVLTGSILLLFIFWEITALCSYALISFYNDDPKAVAGGIKALIITQFGGVGMLIGALLVYAYLGDYQISTFHRKSPHAARAHADDNGVRVSGGGGGEIRAGPVPYLAARRDGSAHARSAP